MPNCAHCTTDFEISDQDKVYYQRINVPEPTHCSSCRMQRRLAYRNERNLYHRKCDLMGKQIISMYHPDTDFPVYGPDAWFGDNWNPLNYGRDFDFTKPFFEQFYELQKKVPRLSLISENNENCDYCNIVGDSKNCYLIYGSIVCEDCYYGNPYYSKNAVDSMVVRHSEITYECVDSGKLYECYFCQDCANCKRLYFCFDVANSNDCFLCVGLRKKSFCILNKQYSEDEYRKKLSEINFGDAKTTIYLKKQLEELKRKSIHPAIIGSKNENVTGDHIYESKNCRNLFYGDQCEEVNYSSNILKSNHCNDCDYGEFGEFLYENSGYYKISNSLFCHWCWGGVDSLIYSSICTKGSGDSFGCIGLKRNRYCILNKQYSKEEYESLVPKIIEHMKSTGEWGEFFPIQISPFAYNETIAQDFFPLSKQEVEENHWNWIKDAKTKSYKGPIIKIPNDVNDASYDITKEILLCEITGEPFKIIPQELKFYKKHNLPIPRRSPNQRYLDRLALRSSNKLWDRKCDKCNTKLVTTLSPERPEKVYCEYCYLKNIY